MWSKLTRKLSHIGRKASVAWFKMSRQEQTALLILLIILLLCIGLKIRDNYLSQRPLIPARGGIYKEGVVGQPKLINPLLATNQAEQTLNRLIYQGAYEYNSQGKVVPLLADKLKMNQDRTKFTLTIKKNVKWSNGKNLTIEDFIATVRMVQAPAYQGGWKGDWQAVQLDRDGKYTVKIITGQPTVKIKQILTMPIMPKETLEEIDPLKLSLHAVNQEPIGSGPYQLDNIIFQESMTQVMLSPNQYYHSNRPYLAKLSLICYQDYQSMLAGFHRSEINAISFIKPSDLEDFQNDPYQLREFEMPRITAVFFNLDKKYLQDKAYRQALTQAIDKKRLVKDILKGHGKIIDGPLPIPAKDQNYQPKKAKQILKSYRKKKLDLLIGQDPFQQQLAEALKEQWQKVGIKVRLDIIPLDQIGLMLNQNKEYDLLLFGQNLSMNSDLFSFWHSSQIKEGFNFSSYSSSQVDLLLEQAQIATTNTGQKKRIKEANQIIKANSPALFLFKSNYLQLVPKELKGIKQTGQLNDSIDRLFDLESWYIKERRGQKKS